MQKGACGVTTEKKKCNTWDTEESFVSQHMTNTCSGKIIVPSLSIRNETALGETGTLQFYTSA